MTEESIGWEEEPRARRDAREEDEDAFGGFGEVEAEDDLDLDVARGEEAERAEEEPSSDAGEEVPRRRRRRGRRRRGGGGEAEGEAKPERSSEEGGAAPRDMAERDVAGRAIEAEFDDDHEDDEEALALRRSRRGRRRRGGAGTGAGAGVAASDRGVGHDTPQSSNYDEEVGEDDGDVVLQNTQRNVPTWAEAVDLLIAPNLESRKREPARGGRGRGRRRD